MSTNIGKDFTSYIPSLSDDANIQEAFRMYHYGRADGTEPAPADSVGGIEGYLADLQFQIENLATGADIVTDLGNSQNLNEIITSGAWRRSSAPPTGLNYPELSAGLLLVTAATTDVIYQVYQTLGGSSGTNHYYWRGRDAANNWSEWAQSSKSTHTHDSLYYRKAEIDARVTDQALLAASSVVVTDSSKKITTSSVISTSELEHLNGVTSNIQSQLNDRYTKSESARIFVKDPATGNPTGAVTGDLWFW